MNVNTEHGSKKPNRDFDMSILENVQRLLTVYAQGVADLSFSEVAEQLDLPKSSASHLLHQMHRFGLLEQNPRTRRYRTSTLLAQASQPQGQNASWDALCWQVLEHLSERTGLTAYLSTLNGAQTMVIQRLDGRSPVQVVSPPGSLRAACDTAMGRAMLSRLTVEEFETLYGNDAQRPIEPPSQARLATVGALMGEVVVATRQHHAVLVDAALPGVGAVAAAVRHPMSGELRGFCVSFVAGVHAPMDLPSINRYRQLMLDEVGTLGRRVGDRFWTEPALPSAQWSPTL